MPHRPDVFPLSAWRQVFDGDLFTGARPVIRRILPDDRLAMRRGHKRALKSLAEVGIPVEDRSIWPILELDGRVLWVPGVRRAYTGWVYFRYHELCSDLSHAGDKVEAGRVLISEEEIAQRLRGMGEQISRDYEGESLLVVGVLRGAFMVMADLARHIRAPAEFDFMAVSSYGSATKTSGVVRILKDLDEEIAGRHVLLVEGHRRFRTHPPLPSRDP